MKERFSGKHSKPKSNSKKNTIISIILLICFIIAIAILTVNKRGNEKDVKIIINNTLNALKTADIEQVNKYLDYKELVSTLDEMIIQENEVEVSNLEQQLFNSMEWEIKDVEVDEDIYKVTIEMNNKDFKEIIIKWIREIVEKKAKDEFISNELFLSTLESIINESINKKTVTKEITIEKQGENWCFIVNDNLRNLVFTGIESVATVIDS